MLIMRDLVILYPKAQNIEKKTNLFSGSLWRNKLVLINSLREYQMTKESPRTIFRMEKSCSVISKWQNVYP